jgi:tagaturonate reductase
MRLGNLTSKDHLKTLNQTSLNPSEKAAFHKMRSSPVTILQIGEGSFLRGFFDWMIQVCRNQGLYKGSIVVAQPRPSGKIHLDKLKKQDGIYTLMIRGIEQGSRVERLEKIAVFNRMVDPYTEWPAFLELAENPDLEVVVSNTTEAGLVYSSVPLQQDQPILSFPGKLTAFLYRRFEKFDGAADKGLILLPCELIERNGDELKRIVLQHCKDWGLSEAFTDWLKEHNRFLNSLVDRIVPGFPKEEADGWFEKLGYEDPLLNTAEPYHLWAIEAEDQLEQKLPFRQAGLNVCWVKDLRPFQIRKVRILNGAHTLMTPLALLHGLNEVREVMEHSRFGVFVKEAVDQAIIPSLLIDHSEARVYANDVFERFSNPFIRHRLLDIAMNSLSKFKVRLLPSLEAYLDKQGSLPQSIVQAFAGLIRFYQVKLNGENYEGRRLDGESYIVRDDLRALDYFAQLWALFDEQKLNLLELVNQVLSNSGLWGKDLSLIPGLAESITAYITEMEADYE